MGRSSKTMVAPDRVRRLVSLVAAVVAVGVGAPLGMAQGTMTGGSLDNLESVPAGQVGSTTTGPLPGGGDGQPPAAQAEAESGDREAPKWWSLGLGIDFNHATDLDHPNLTTALNIDPSFTLPWNKITIGLHFGLQVSHDYARKSQTGETTFTQWDGQVSSIRLGVPIYAHEASGLRLGASLTGLIPYTSRFDGIRNQWYFSYEPGLGLSWSKWGVSASVGGSFRQNIHAYDNVMLDNAGGDMVPLTQYRVAGNFSLGYSRWGFSLTGRTGIVRSFRYRTDLMEQENIAVMYALDLTYSFAEVGVSGLDALSVSVGFSTAGPERRNGGFGSDRTYPLDPRFSAAYLSLAYGL